MRQQEDRRFVAFQGSRLVASGDLAGVAEQARMVLDRADQTPVSVFDQSTSELVELDLRGTVEDVRRRYAAPDPAPRPRGRPRLGVIPREVTLLPRHWEWLASQPGGASVAIRKLVDGARRTNADRDRVRKAQDAAYRFMTAMAGNQPGFEEAIRALYACNQNRFDQVVENWPADIRDHSQELAIAAFWNSQ